MSDPTIDTFTPVASTQRLAPSAPPAGVDDPATHEVVLQAEDVTVHMGRPWHCDPSRWRSAATR